MPYLISLHGANITVHVVSGVAALALGLVQLVSEKGGRLHTTVGRWFTSAIWIVVATAVLGVVAFEFRAFLSVLTLLVAYWNYSNVRTLRNRANGPSRQDAVAATCGLLAVALFLYLLPRVRFPWVPSVVYSTLFTFALVTLYDLSRFAFPKVWFARLWIHEHVVKSIGAYSAVVSAFAGTVLPAWQPYSQMVPPLAGFILQVVFVVRCARRPGAGSAVVKHVA